MANIPVEQHLFRQLEQQVDQFVCQLQQKSDVDEAIRDQLIEKCRDARLRLKFFEKAGNAKLKEMQYIVHAYEAVAKENKGEKGSKGGKPKSGGFQDKRCYNCNHVDHLASDRQCPARGKMCRKCGDTGPY